MPDLQPYMTYIVGGLLLLAAIVLLLIIAKLFGARARGKKGLRLGIVEYHEVDQSRRLVLLRRDNVEHLVLIGGHQDLVIEQGITHGANEGFAPQEQTMDDVVPIRPLRPAVFGNRRPALRPVGAATNEDQNPA